MPDPKLISRGNGREWQRTHRAPEIVPFPVRVPECRSQILRKENCAERLIRRQGFSTRDNPPRTSSNRRARGRGLEYWRSEPLPARRSLQLGEDWHFGVIREG